MVHAVGFRVHMILYKFKSTKDFYHVVDIMENERLFCSEYEKLNDPFEAILGFIPLTPEGPPNIAFLREMSRQWEEHLSPLKSYRVCSLSQNIDNILMWAHYALGFQGVCFELDIPDSTSSVYNVKYVADLECLNISEPIEYLTNKLACWRYESESRIITQEQYFDVANQIKKVYLGGRMKNCYTETIADFCLRKGWGLSVVQPALNGTLRFI